MTSGCPPSCRPMLFALRSLRSFVAAFVSANLPSAIASAAAERQSADPQPSFVAFVASCEISLFARDLRSPYYLNPLHLCALRPLATAPPAKYYPERA
jgi:hypothetical protein